jgi:hypothetical protein
MDIVLRDDNLKLVLDGGALGMMGLLENGGDINIARRMARHSNIRTMEPYDRRSDEFSFSEIEKVGI